jgi:HlyD family secretion protein
VFNFQDKASKSADRAGVLSSAPGLPLGVPRASTELELALPTKESPPEPVQANNDFFPSLEGEYAPPPKSGRKRIWIGAVPLGVAAIAATLLWRYASHPAPPTFQFARVERGRIDATVSATGACNAVVDVQVGSQVSGNINAFYADFNTHVKKGQLVALIDPAPFEAAVNQADATLNAAKAAVVTARANLAKAQSDQAGALANVANEKANEVKAQSAVDLAKLANERQQALVKDGISAQQDAETAKAAYDQALASMNAAQATLNASQAAAQSSQQQIAVTQAQIE